VNELQSLVIFRRTWYLFSVRLYCKVWITATTGWVKDLLTRGRGFEVAEDIP